MHSKILDPKKKYLNAGDQQLLGLPSKCFQRFTEVSVNILIHLLMLPNDILSLLLLLLHITIFSLSTYIDTQLC